LAVTVSAMGKITVENAGGAKLAVDGTKAWKRLGERNKLTLERTKENFVIKANGDEVGAIPLGIVSGKFKTVTLGLTLGSKTRPQPPRIHSIRLVPQKEEE
jgi:hypothetical protein